MDAVTTTHRKAPNTRHTGAERFKLLQETAPMSRIKICGPQGTGQDPREHIRTGEQAQDQHRLQYKLNQQGDEMQVERHREQGGATEADVRQMCVCVCVCVCGGGSGWAGAQEHRTEPEH